jgi:MerR family mercuric resistance operon transcriptional regulator
MARDTGRLTITALAQAGGVTRETIRFYEQRGLLAAPPRSAAGYRLYPADARPRLRFIRSAQALGFSLEEIAELLALRAGPGNTCAAVKARAEAKIADIERKIAALAAMRTALTEIAAACDGGTTSASECPILATIQSDGEAA